MNKKITILLAGLVLAARLTAFGQGYVLFVTAKSGVYDDFTTPGAGVVAPGDVTGTFLWNANTSATDPLGAGLSTTATTAGNAWATIASMLTNGWSIAQDYNAGATPTEADVADNASGAFKGQQQYDGGESFQLANSPAGANIEVVVVGWDSLGGDGSLGAAEAAGDPVGWSGEFTYFADAPVGPAF